MPLWKNITGLVSKGGKCQHSEIGQNSMTKDENLRNYQESYLDELFLSLNIKRTQSLEINDSKICRLPESIGKLIYLTEIDLSRNALWCVPDAMRNLERLEILNLSCNKLTQFPIVVTTISTLKSLDLSSNAIPILPPAIFKLKKLTTLNLVGNEIKLPLPGCKNITVQEIFEAFKNKYKENCRHNIWASWRPSYDDSPKGGVRRLVDLCTDCILYSKIDYKSGKHVPPLLKSYLTEEEHSCASSSLLPNLLKCSECKKYFTNKNNFIYHECY